MKLSQIEQILEVARAGSISRAAENLYESQPTLSLSIKRLEEEIGETIFIRSGSGVTLTHFGESFIQQAKNIMIEVDVLQDICDSQGKTVALPLRVGSLGSYNLPHFFAELLKKYPNNSIEISWFDMDLDQQIEALKNDEIDIGVLTLWNYKKQLSLKKISAKGLDYRRIAPSQIGVFVSADDTALLAGKSSVVPSDLEGKTLVMMEDQDKLLTYLKKNGIVIPGAKTKIHVSDIGTMREAVRAVNGYFFSTDCSALHPEGVSFTDVVFLPFDFSGISAEVGIILNKQAPRSVLADELISEMTFFSC